MISFFSTGYISRYLLLLLLGTLIWLPSLLFPMTYTGISGFAFNQFTYLTNQNIWLQTATAFLLTLIAAFLVNRIAIGNGFSGKISTLVALIYLLVTSSFIYEFHNNPLIWVNIILVTILRDLMRLPHVSNTIPVVFNASFLLGLASLFYPPLIFLVLLIWSAIVIHRVVNWRNFAVTLIGIIIPYIFLFTWFFFIDNLYEELTFFIDSLHIDITPVLLREPVEIAISVIFTLISVISILGVIGRLNEKNINLRRNLIINLTFIVIAFLIILVFSKSIISTLVLCIPASIIVGHWLSNVSKLRWYNILLSVATLLIILNQFLYLLFILI